MKFEKALKSMKTAVCCGVLLWKELVAKLCFYKITQTLVRSRIESAVTVCSQLCCKLTYKCLWVLCNVCCHSEWLWRCCCCTDAKIVPLVQLALCN